jgi:hypothetical protein
MVLGRCSSRPLGPPQAGLKVLAIPPLAFFGGLLYQVQQTCKCGAKYWPSQRWIHEECGVVSPTTVTTATNRIATNTNAESATNRERGLPVRDSGRVDCSEPAVDGVSPGGSGAGKTKNRRSKEAYNAYQREYMRRRRAKILPL